MIFLFLPHPYTFYFFSFLFFFYLLWLGLPVQCWMEVAMVGIHVLLVILRRFFYLALYPWVCVLQRFVWGLFGFFSLYPLFWFGFVWGFCLFGRYSIELESSLLVLNYHKYTLYFSKWFCFASAGLIIFFPFYLLMWFILVIFLKLN